MSFRTRKKGPLKAKYVFILVLILITLVSVQGFLFVEENLEPVLKEIAKTYVKQIATLAINEAITKKISEDVSELDQLMIIKEYQDKIQLISFDQSKQARIVSQVTDKAYKVLLELSRDSFSLPLGQAMDSNILAQFGPSVPITLVPIGSAKADIQVRTEEVGINNVSIVVYLIIEASVKVVIPFSSDEAVVRTEFPIANVFVPGDVPNYYFRGADGQITPIPTLPIGGSEGETGTDAEAESEGNTGENRR